jgi:hypothetical protein
VCAEAEKEDTRLEIDNEIMDEVVRFPATYYVEDCSSTTHFPLDCILTNFSKFKAHAHKITSRIAEFYQRFLQKHSSTYFLLSSCCSKMKQIFTINICSQMSIHGESFHHDTKEEKLPTNVWMSKPLHFPTKADMGQFIHYSQEYACRS